MKDVVLKINNGAFKGALRSGFESAMHMAYEVQAEAKELCTIGKTGRLRNSIMVSSTGQDTATVSTDTYYAPYVEFGTRYMKAQPFLRPGADLAQLEDVKKITNKTMKEELRAGKIVVIKY